jgi:hypothetical protein
MTNNNVFQDVITEYYRNLPKCTEPANLLPDDIEINAIGALLYNQSKRNITICSDLVNLLSNDILNRYYNKLWQQLTFNMHKILDVENNYDFKAFMLDTYTSNKPNPTYKINKTTGIEIMKMNFESIIVIDIYAGVFSEPVEYVYKSKSNNNRIFNEMINEFTKIQLAMTKM